MVLQQRKGSSHLRAHETRRFYADTDELDCGVHGAGHRQYYSIRASKRIHFILTYSTHYRFFAQTFGIIQLKEERKKRKRNIINEDRSGVLLL